MKKIRIVIEVIFVWKICVYHVGRVNVSSKTFCIGVYLLACYGIRCGQFHNNLLYIFDFLRNNAITYLCKKNVGLVILVIINYVLFLGWRGRGIQLLINTCLVNVSNDMKIWL